MSQGLAGKPMDQFLAELNEERKLDESERFYCQNRFACYIYLQCLIRSSRRKYSQINVEKYFEASEKAVKTYSN